jgi:hypothetical protein
MPLSDADGPRANQSAGAASEKTTSVNTEATTSGFRARLDGLSLFDLVQMECLARSRRVIRVASAGRVGYLFFRDGEIFHAATRHLAGERAAQEMLGWTDGTFEPCNIAWPEQPSITRSWQSLLLGAATSMDEESAGKLVRLPTSRRVGHEAEPAAPSEAPPSRRELVQAVADSALSAPPEPSVRPSSQAPPSSGGVHRAVRVDPSGRVLSTAGDSTDLAGFAAYASRVGELIGESLGLGRFTALDLGFGGSRAVLYIEDDGNVVVAEAANQDALASIARRAGF